MHERFLILATLLVIGLGSTLAPADVIITIQPPTPQQMTAPSRTVEICCKGIAGGLAWHCFTKCTKKVPGLPDGITACRGGPTGLFGNEWPWGVPGSPNHPPPCSGWTLIDGAWGPIDTYCGPYEKHHPDWPDDGSPRPCESAATGTDCGMCDCIKNVMCRIELCCVRYELLPELYGFNSNSTAFTAITLCQPPGGGIQPLPFPEAALGAPGWPIEIPLLNCPTCP